MTRGVSEDAKAALVQALETEALAWAARRHEAHDEAAWWEAKARWMLLLEAKALVAAVAAPDDGDARGFVASVAERLGAYDDWGWGANWSDDVHARASAWVRAFVASSIVEVLARSGGGGR